MRAFFLAAALVAAPVFAWAQECGPFTGDVVPFRSSKVNARIIGNVAEVAVEEGQSIEEGATLARLDDSLQRAQYELAKFEAANDSAVKAAEVQLRKADLDLERVKKLGGTAAPMEFDNATANRDFAAANLRMKEMELEQAKTNLKPWEASLEQYLVRAPFKGVVARKIIEVGETTAPVERPLFEVIDCSKVYVTLSVPVTVASRLEAGSPATVAVDCLSGETFQGAVNFVAPSLEPGTQYVRVKVLVDNAEGRLRPWMAAQVTFGAPSAAAAEAAAPAAPGDAAPTALKDAVEPASEVVVSK